MICPHCLAVLLEHAPKLVAYAASYVPAVGPVLEPLAEALTKALIRLARGDDLGPAARAELPDHEAVVRRLLEEES